MKILYLSTMFDEHMLSNIFNKGKMPHPAANKYHQLLCRGVAANGAEVETYSTLPISSINSTHKFVKIKPRKQGNLTRGYIPLCNLPGLKHLMLLIGSFFKVLFSKKDTVLLYDVLMISSSLGALAAAHIRGIRSVGIVTDLPVYIHTEKQRLILSLNRKVMEAADGYVFITRQMNEVVNKEDKPYIVLEGLVDSEPETAEHLPMSGKKKVVYAGGLQRKYGVANLVDSFVRCAKEDEELHIYGDGDYAHELKKIVGKAPNIIYHGSCPNSEVVGAELGAALLVNPRTSEGDYTKYSFPSKNLEYMASGTPVLMAKLPGIPDEYDRFVYYFDDNDPKGLEKAMRALLDRSYEELLEKGADAKDFVLAQKNHVRQAGRILDFISRMRRNK